MSVKYIELSPSVELEPYIESYWFQVFDGFGAKKSPVQTCLPIGMTHLIFHVGNSAPCEVFENRQWLSLPDAFVVGLYRDAVDWRTAGNCIAFGVNLKPECLMYLLDAPASILFSSYVDLSEFIGYRSEKLYQDLNLAGEPAGMIRVFDEFVRERLSHRTLEDHYVGEATRLIRKMHGNINIAQLSDRLSVSERQLQREFKETIGTSPKTYARIIRFRTAMEYLQRLRNDNVSWVEIAYYCGYADQAHFIRDFKEFTGRLPSFILKNENHGYQLSRELVY